MFYLIITVNPLVDLEKESTKKEEENVSKSNKVNIKMLYS